MIQKKTRQEILHIIIVIAFFCVDVTLEKSRSFDNDKKKTSGWDGMSHWMKYFKLFHTKMNREVWNITAIASFCVNEGERNGRYLRNISMNIATEICKSHKLFTNWKQNYDSELNFFCLNLILSRNCFLISFAFLWYHKSNIQEHLHLNGINLERKLFEWLVELWKNGMIERTNEPMGK